jgi:hypothetical protein
MLSQAFPAQFGFLSLLLHGFFTLSPVFGMMRCWDDMDYSIFSALVCSAITDTGMGGWVCCTLPALQQVPAPQCDLNGGAWHSVCLVDLIALTGI